MNVSIIDSDRVLIDGHLYKKQRTCNGKYSKTWRREYMRNYRERKRNIKDISIEKYIDIKK